MALHDGRTIGLALSGGGFRATLFGLGSLWRLNDDGLLGKLDRVTSVSGGSILAGVLASKWSKLNFIAGRAENFDSIVAKPVIDFCSLTADIEAGLLGWITPFRSAGDYLKSHYKNELFGEIKIKDIPRRERNVTPLFVFYATNMQTGRSFRFRQDFIADYMLGINEFANPSLATAVTASSAFPPIFSPVIYEPRPNDWRDSHPESDPELLPGLRRKVVLADGGIYDNMGLECLNEDIKLVSDAGAPFKIDEIIGNDYFSQLNRVRDILIDQTRALRKRELVGQLSKKILHGAYWGIDTEIAKYSAENKLVTDSSVTRSLASVPTRLSSVEPNLQNKLINWGYALADAAIRTHTDISSGAVFSLPK